MIKINIFKSRSDEACRLGTCQEIYAHLSLTNPADFEHIRILRYCDSYDYVLHEE